jgi:hypothetical protein
MVGVLLYNVPELELLLRFFATKVRRFVTSASIARVAAITFFEPSQRAAWTPSSNGYCFVISWYPALVLLISNTTRTTCFALLCNAFVSGIASTGETMVATVLRYYLINVLIYWQRAH